MEKELFHYCCINASVVHMMDDMGNDLIDHTFAAGISGDNGELPVDHWHGE